MLKFKTEAEYQRWLATTQRPALRVVPPAPEIPVPHASKAPVLSPLQRRHTALVARVLAYATLAAFPYGPLALALFWFFRR